ncbi:Ubiquitin-like-specific protease 1A [Platanthera zijinensis]|uniref:Ubiquitin-like-specific protease 1A n=1 Tax=Platanthera zijinensis TaxID=2320716 RepID=A0AAP0B256_9ASPA
MSTKRRRPSDASVDLEEKGEANVPSHHQEINTSFFGGAHLHLKIFPSPASSFLTSRRKKRRKPRRKRLQNNPPGASFLSSPLKDLELLPILILPPTKISSFPAVESYQSVSFLFPAGASIVGGRRSSPHSLRSSSMPGSKYLSCRCAPNTFTANVRPLLNRLSEESIEALRDARLLPLFRMPPIPQNIPMLYVLLRLYNKDKQAFQLGKYLVKMTVNEVALILGLPNAGLHFKFSRSPVLDKTHKKLTEEIHRAADEEGSHHDEGIILSMLVNYLIAMFFFPLKSLKVPSCITEITCLPEFLKYNWPLAIHEFLHLQFDHLSRVSAVRNAGSNIGSLEGCATVLLVWMYEHTKLQPPLVDLARPRVCRWSPTLKYSAKFCMKVQDNLFIKNYVIREFRNVLVEEKVLLGMKMMSQILKHDHRRKKKKKRVKFATMDFVGEKLGYENKIDEKRSMRSKERFLTRMIRSEVKRARNETDEGWRGLEDRLKAYIKEEVAGLKNFCESWFKSLQSECKPSFSSVPTTQLSQPTSTLENIIPPKTEVITVSPRKVKKAICKRAPTIHETDVQYPGRLLLTKRARESVDYVLCKFVDRSMLIFESGNISMSRGDVDDLLGQGWVMDNHLNAYSVVIGAKRRRTPQKIRSFLYVSPNHEYYKRSNARNYTTLISHITEEAVNSSEIIIMPCHLTSHWALLVCWIKEQRWEFFDSLPSSLHRAGIRANLKALQDDVPEAFPEGFVNWPVADAVGVPCQDNSWDCGVFVVKFMEVISSTETISWADQKNWQADMPRFRAEIVAEIFKTFSSSISESIARLDSSDA